MPVPLSCRMIYPSSQGLGITPLSPFCCLDPSLLFRIIPMCIKNKHEKLPFSPLLPFSPSYSPIALVSITPKFLEWLLCPLPRSLPSWCHWNGPCQDLQWLPCFCPNLFNLTTASSWTLAWFLVCFFPPFLPSCPHLLSLPNPTLYIGKVQGFGLRFFFLLSTPSPWHISPVPRNWNALFLLWTPKFLTNPDPSSLRLAHRTTCLYGFSLFNVSWMFQVWPIQTRDNMQFWAFEN